MDRFGKAVVSNFDAFRHMAGKSECDADSDGIGVNDIAGNKHRRHGIRHDETRWLHVGGKLLHKQFRQAGNCEGDVDFGHRRLVHRQKIGAGIHQFDHKQRADIRGRTAVRHRGMPIDAVSDGVIRRIPGMVQTGWTQDSEFVQFRKVWFSTVAASMNTAYNIVQAALKGIPENIKQLFHKKLSKDFTAFAVKRGVKTPDQAIDTVENAIKNQSGKDWQHIKPYMKWIIIKYAKGGIDYWEHVDAVVEYLLMFNKLKRQNKLTSQEKDINRIKDMYDLRDLIEKYEEEDVSSGSEKDKKIEQELYDRKEAILIHNSEKVKIVRPLTEKASDFFGRSTRWCTTGTKSSFAD